MTDTPQDMHRIATDQTAEIIRLRDALFSATASLTGAASAYRKYAKRHKLHGTAETDAVFSTRVNDFDKAVNSARAALAAKS
jgi:Mg2+ and Co2+ transporter CorA